MSEESIPDNSHEETRSRQRARILGGQRRLARWGEDRPGLTDTGQPVQPLHGPGGRDYPHTTVRSVVNGDDALAYWLFEPADPAPASAPLIIFLHGWGGNNPANFGAWIDHLVKRGNLVAFPVYQDVSLKAASSTMLANVITAIKDAIQRHQQMQAIRPDLERVAIVGHSFGGTLAAQIAAAAEREGLPVPKAIMPVAAAQGASSHQSSSELCQIPSTVLMLVVVGEDDQNAGDTVGRVIYIGTPQVPTLNKNLIVLRSDYYGTPPLVANHRSPGASNPAYWAPRGEQRLRPAIQRFFPRDLPPVDAMDYYGYWKFFDGLTDAAFYGRNRVYALGDTPQQRFMGTWSDGTPVKEPRVIIDPRMLW